MAGNFGGKIFWQIAKNMSFSRIYFGSYTSLSHNDIHNNNLEQTIASVYLHLQPPPA